MKPAYTVRLFFLFSSFPLFFVACDDPEAPNTEAEEYCLSQGGQVETSSGESGAPEDVCAFYSTIVYDEGSVEERWACPLDDFLAGTCEKEEESADPVLEAGPPTMGDSVVHVVKNLMSTVRETKYTNSGYVVDSGAGKFYVDCSYWAKQVLTRVSSEHYAQLPKHSSGGTTALARDYHDFFAALPDNDPYWERVPNIHEARAGDVIAYAHPVSEGAATTGHVMILMSTPRWSTCSDNLQHWVWVSDAARSGHGEDTRNGDGKYAGDYSYTALDGSGGDPSGVGLGKMWFNTGSSPYYRWSSCAASQHQADLAIGRLRKRN